MIDLYIEQVDPKNPDNYLEGEQSIPFILREEVIRISDKAAESGLRSETLLVRGTGRGPVISDHGMSTVQDKVVSLRWSVSEMLGTENGNRRLLLSKNVAEAIDAIGTMPTPLNYIVVDTAGNIARVASGAVPLRVRGDGSIPLAERLAPVLITAIQSDPELNELADILGEWDFMDTKEQAAPAIFQSLYRHFAWRVFEDELGADLATEYLKGYYYWHEHLVRKIEENNSNWFDDKTTAAVATRDDIFRLAAHDALAELGHRFGDNPHQWRWGDAHTVSFFHPLVKSEAGTQWLGGGTNSERVPATGYSVRQ